MSEGEADVEVRASCPLQHRTEHPTLPPAPSKLRGGQGHVAPSEPLSAGAIKPSQVQGGAAPQAPPWACVAFYSSVCVCAAVLIVPAVPVPAFLALCSLHQCCRAPCWPRCLSRLQRICFFFWGGGGNYMGKEPHVTRGAAKLQTVGGARHRRAVAEDGCQAQERKGKGCEPSTGDMRFLAHVIAPRPKKKKAQESRANGGQGSEEVVEKQMRCKGEGRGIEANNEHGSTDARSTGQGRQGQARLEQ